MVPFFLRARSARRLRRRALRARKKKGTITWAQVRVMVEFGTSSAFREWVRVRVLGYGFGVRGKKVKSRDCALASDFIVKAHVVSLSSQQDCISLALRAPYGTLHTRGVLSEFRAARTCASYCFDNGPRCTLPGCAALLYVPLQ